MAKIIQLTPLKQYFELEYLINNNNYNITYEHKGESFEKLNKNRKFYVL